MKKTWLFQPVYYVILAFYLIFGYTTLGWGEKWAAALYPEDHYFENVGAISLFVASAISFYIFLRAWRTRGETRLFWVKQVAYLAFAVLYFFGAGEEISWGQRIFHFQEPEAMTEQNIQGEFNIHNLAVVEGNKFLKADNLFNVYWFSFAVLIPGLSLAWTRFRQFAEKFIPIVYWGIGALFLFNYLLAKLAKLVFASAYSFQTISFAQAVQEIKESNYELLFVFLSLAVLWDLNRLISEKSKRVASPAS